MLFQVIFKSIGGIVVVGVIALAEHAAVGLHRVFHPVTELRLHFLRLPRPLIFGLLHLHLLVRELVPRELHPLVAGAALNKSFGMIF